MNFPAPHSASDLRLVLSQATRAAPHGASGASLPCRLPILTPECAATSTRLPVANSGIDMGQRTKGGPVHTVVFIQECGPVIGQYPFPREADEQAVDLRAMEMRWIAANHNPACIAAFWYVDGEMHRFQFNRA